MTLRVKLLYIFFILLSCNLSAKADSIPVDIRATGIPLPSTQWENVSEVRPDAAVDAATKARNDSASNSDRNWWRLMWKGKLSMKDTTVQYPRFVKFCVDVYNWGDRTFNSYDTTYVVGTGRRWKTRIEFDAWADSYNMHLKKLPITLISDPYTTAAIYLQYMAVSINYAVDLNNLMFNKPVNHRKMQFGFNCARFNLDLAFNSSTGGSYVRTLGDYKRGRLFKEYMPGVKMTSLTADLYYYFNNRKYANGAAYFFSKIQKKSSGSFILGFTFSYEDNELDFNTLPKNLQPFMTYDEKEFRFHYYNYCLLFGYGFNWVLSKRLLYNVSILPSIGIMHCYEDSHDGKVKLFSMNLKGRMSLTYNNGDFFTGLILRLDGHWYKTRQLSVFSAIENASLSVGVRF